MLSKEVDDVLFHRLPPLDVLTSRFPHCSMKVTSAYMYDQKVATAYLRASLKGPSDDCASLFVGSRSEPPTA